MKAPADAPAPWSARQRAALARKLLAWYGRHQRPLPWRLSGDPYHVWVSEIMLQQTQVATVLPYYARWLERFPSVEALAAAPLSQVLAAWEGLGYYSRARNLHRAAQVVVREHGGALPASVAGLLALPGIGRYTAGAIASIAFGVDAPVLDGNVKRVLARLADYAGDVKRPAGERALWALAGQLLPAGRAGDFNQALMELGARVCVPRTPDCPACPVQAWCLARQRGVQHLRPVTAPRRAAPERTWLAAVVTKRGRVLLEQRPAEGHRLLGGLWGFPALQDPPASGARALRAWLWAEHDLRVGPLTPLATLQHSFTHFRLTLHVFRAEWRSGAWRRPGSTLPPGPVRRWVSLGQLADYPMGKLDRAISRGLVGTAAGGAAKHGASSRRTGKTGRKRPGP